eukprot:6479161-Amphidinium_carterae.2
MEGGGCRCQLFKILAAALFDLRFRDFFRSERKALRSGESAPRKPCAEAVQWPCGWAFPDVERGLLKPPQSKCRRQRWNRWLELKRYVNFKVCYLSWLHLGRPSPASCSMHCCPRAKRTHVKSAYPSVSKVTQATSTASNTLDHRLLSLSAAS